MTNRQIDKCQFWYKGGSKRFVEIMYSIEAFKTEIFFGSWREYSLRSTFEMLESSFLKIFSLILWRLLNSIEESFIW